MDMRYMEEIVEIAELGSLSKAAKSLFITQSALSKHLVSVEREFGIELFDRSGGKLELTEGGRLFVEGARDILARSRFHLAKVRAADGGVTHTFVVAGNLRRDSLFSGTARATSRLVERYPDAHVDLQDIGVRDYTDILRDGRADVIVSYLYPELGATGLSCRFLHRAPFAVTVHKSHPFACRNSVAFEELTPFDVYVYEYENRTMYHAYLQSIFSRHGLAPAANTQPSFYFGFSDCARGVLVSPYFSSYETYYPDCRSILLDWPTEGIDVGIVWSEDGRLECPKGAKLLMLLEDELRDFDYTYCKE